MCPVCGYHPLRRPPYKNYLGIVPEGAKPPYFDTLGQPSNEVCAGCQYEYGFDDEPGGAAVTSSFEEYREWWLARGGEVIESPPSR